MKAVGKLAEEVNPGTFVYYIREDDSADSDKRATFWGNLTDEVAKVCADLAAHPILSTAPAINALGFSQGGQFMRAYVERCNVPPVASLVTFGAQHNGISEFQNCADGDWLCGAWEGLLKGQTWSNFVQKNLVPAQYYRDPEDLESYLEYSNFLADINNERSVKNKTYVANMKKLEHFAMYIFDDDKTVVPKWSGWFSEYNATSEKRTKLQDRNLYKEDWLGLKWLDERDRLDFRNITGGHMSLSDRILKDAFRTYFSKRVQVEEMAQGNSLDL